MGMVAILVNGPGPMDKLLFPHPKEAPYEIKLSLAQWFLRRRCLKSVDDRRTTEACLYYKLPNEPLAQVS